MVGYLILIIVAIYFVRIVFIVISWHTAKPYITHGQQQSVSIVIPFRNEKDNLAELSEALLAQEGVNVEVEFIFVDDHSTDLGAESICKGLPHQLIHPVSHRGKKKAIETGIMSARYDNIITLDADVVPGKKWLATICDAMHQTQADLLILPVEILPGEKTLEKLQSLEFMSVTGITAGTAMHSKPVMCNGANLAFRKKAWLETNQQRNDDHLASGDDMFFLHQLKGSGKIMWLHSKDVMVGTSAMKDLRSLFSQRIRWSSKSIHFKDRDTIFLGTIVLLTQLILLFAFFLALTKTTSWATFKWVFLFKTFADFLLLHAVARWSGRNKVLKYLPILVVLHPLYVAITLLGTLVYKPAWKDRKI
ncbi:MAG: glycosyltransferase [Flavobacteriales bacterium]|nr:glycosyltransferase [Flavobacteriales bacterium]